MKNVVVLIFSLVTADTFGQNRLPPLYYLNGAEIDMENVYVNASRIDDVRVDKSTERGAVYLTTKEPLTFLTLDEILKNNGVSDSIGHVVYMVNNKLITDKSKVKVDASYFMQVEIERLHKLSYINEVYKSLIFVDIQLLNEKPKPVMRIRGSAPISATAYGQTLRPILVH